MTEEGKKLVLRSNIFLEGSIEDKWGQEDKLAGVEIQFF